jgi:hypothetical protein
MNNLRSRRALGVQAFLLSGPAKLQAVSDVRRRRTGGIAKGQLTRINAD